jgi:hypothetical protein
MRLPFIVRRSCCCNARRWLAQSVRSAVSYLISFATVVRLLSRTTVANERGESGGGGGGCAGSGWR